MWPALAGIAALALGLSPSALLGAGCHLLLPTGGGDDRTHDRSTGRDLATDLQGGIVADRAPGDGRVPLGPWVKMTPNTQGNLLDVWGSSAKDVWAVGAEGAVLHYDGNPSGTWHSVPSRTTVNPSPLLRGVHGVDTNQAWVVGGETILACTSVSGCESRYAAFLTGIDLFGVCVFEQELFAVGLGGKALHCSSSTGKCSPEPVAASALKAVWGSSPGNLFAVGDNGQSCKRWGGASWVCNATDTVQLRDLWGRGTDLVEVGTELVRVVSVKDIPMPDSDLFGVWSNGALTYVVGKGITSQQGVVFVQGESVSSAPDPITPSESVPPLHAVWGADSGEVFVVGGQGTIWRYQPPP